MDASTATLIAAGLAAIVTFVVLAINLHQNRKLETIHVLVNDRLDKALTRIEEMRSELDQLKAGLPKP